MSSLKVIELMKYTQILTLQLILQFLCDWSTYLHLVLDCSLLGHNW